MKKMILIFSTVLSLLGIPQPSAAQDYYSNALADDYTARVVNVFPNPARNNTTIVLNYQPLRRTIVDVVDFNGNIRRSFAFAPGYHQLSLDVGFLENGYYVLRVREGGRLIDRIKFIKS